MGETPQFEATFENRFSWGEVQLCYNVKNGIIESARVFSDAMDAELIARAQEALAGCRARGEDMAAAADKISAELAAWIRELPI